MSLMSNLSKFLVPSTYASQQVAPATIQTAPPVSGNPFLQDSQSKDIYGKNRPVPGGYFAGYYNGQANIVGQKLFILI